MASGNTLCSFRPQANSPPATAYATVDTRNSIRVLDFDAATAESAVFMDVLPRNYAGGGLTIYIHWLGDTATAGDVVWGASIERCNTDLDADSFAAEKTATDTTSGTSGIITVTDIAFTSGAEMDSLAVGEAFRLKIRRVATDGADTMAGDASAILVEVTET